MNPPPVTTLANCLRVANFSSLHAFTFDDGSTLAACDLERSQLLSLEAEERDYEQKIRGISITNIDLSFNLTAAIIVELRIIEADDDIDLCIIPLSVKTAYERRHGSLELLHSKCRVIRVKDRINKIIFSDRFCI